MPEHTERHPSPIVVRADSKATIRIAPVDAATESVAPSTYVAVHVLREWHDAGESPICRVDDGMIVVEDTFPSEQEHVIQVDAIANDGQRTQVGTARVYSVGDDLFKLRPFKGDFHLHTHHSDGLESPAYVTARCRQIGLDFMAITDHHKYEPSMEAIAAYADAEVDLRIYPGEEVHPPGNPVHMINFGGRFSVNACFADKAAYDEAVDRRLREGASVPEGVNARHYASTVWSMEKIREGGGLAVFCHPYWVAGRIYPVDARLTDHLLAERPFDAVEVIGGFHRHEVESNALQVARYHEEREKGNPLPIVGLSDSHGCDTGSLFGWYYTIVFAEDAELSSLTDAIKAGRSVAVEHVEGEQPRVHGPYRLVKFAHFLLREYFPLHDELCEREGSAMLAHASDDGAGAETLHRLRGQCERLHHTFYNLDI